MNRPRPHPRSNPRTRLLLAAVAPLCAAILAPAQAVAQEEPIVFNQREKTKTFWLGNWRPELELEYLGQRSAINPVNGPTDRFSEDRFRETFSLEADGYIVHPNLVELDLGGKFGLEQDIIGQTGVDRETRLGTVDEWDLNATILRKEDTPLTVYSRRNEQIVNRQFGPSLTSTLTTTGAALDVRNKPVISRFEAFHSDQDQSGFGESTTGDFSLSQNTFLWHSEYRPDPRQSLSWDYAFNQVSETTEGFGTNEFTSHDLNLGHSISFGAQEQHDLSSSISYFNQGGDFPVERTRINEILRLQHTKRFQTRYQYTYDSTSFGDTDQVQHSARAGFTHRLYESLTTSGNIGVQKVDRSDDANTLETFGDLNLDYRKRVPFGVLNAFAGGYLDRTDNDARTEPTRVLDDARVFTDPQPIVISASGIVPGSIVVTDPSGLLLYQEGLDYTLTVIDNRVEVNRLIGGRIGDGQAVLLDYTLAPQAANTVDTTGSFVGARYTFERGALRGLSLYTRYARQDQSIDSDSLNTFQENSFEDLTFGSEYAIGPFTFGAEREIHDATIVPFDANRYFGRYRRPFGLDTTLTLNAAYTTIDYWDDDNTIDFWTGSAQVRHDFSRRLYGLLTLLYRDQHDELRGDTIGFEQQAELRFEYRKLTVFGLMRNSNLSSDATDNSFQLLQVGVRRTF